MLTNSVHQRFRQDTVGMVCLCSMMSGASGGWTVMACSDASALSGPMTWGWNHLEASSLTCLAVDACSDWDFSWGTTGWPTHALPLWLPHNLETLR